MRKRATLPSTMGEGLYGGLDPRDVPTYSIREVARYLRLPLTTLYQWVASRSYAVKGGSKKRSTPVIKIPKRRPPLLTFWNLAEAFVLAGIRRKHGVSLQSTRRALDYVRQRLDKDRPLIEQAFVTDGVDLFIEKVETEQPELLNASKSGQLAMRDLMKASLKRVHHDPSGLIDTIFPWSFEPDEPCDVEINPSRGFGRLIVTGTRVPTEVLADRFRAGDSISDLADDYRLSASLIESALRWEIAH